MFDNLREESTKEFSEQAKFQPAARSGQSGGGRSRRFLGLTSIQRFVVVVLVMFVVFGIGAVCLLVTQKIMF